MRTVVAWGHFSADVSSSFYWDFTISVVHAVTAKIIRRYFGENMVLKSSTEEDIKIYSLIFLNMRVGTDRYTPHKKNTMNYNLPVLNINIKEPEYYQTC